MPMIQLLLLCLRFDPIHPFPCKHGTQWQMSLQSVRYLRVIIAHFANATVNTELQLIPVKITARTVDTNAGLNIYCCSSVGLSRYL